LKGALGLGALAAWYFKAFLRALLPNLAPDRLGRRARQRDPPLPKGERFVVLIADLQGDDEQNSQTRHVAAALAPYEALDLVRIGPGPEWDIGSREDFEAEVRRHLAEHRGDVLISGDVATKDKALRLRIIPADPSLRPDLRGLEGRRPGEYVLTETGLPLDFDHNFNAVLLALVAASVAPATERQGHYLADLLGPAATKLKQLCTHMPAGLDHDQRGNLWRAYGLATWNLGKQTGRNEWLVEAVGAYQAALEEYTRERVPLDWAATHASLGDALCSLGERESGTARLGEAVTVLQSAVVASESCGAEHLARVAQQSLAHAAASLNAKPASPAKVARL
jgi:hypothetical protein